MKPYLLSILFTFPFTVLSAQASGEVMLRMVPGQIPVGGEVLVSVKAPDKSTSPNLFYFTSDDPINCPVNAMIDNGDLAIVKTGTWNTHGPAKTFFGGTFLNCPDAGGSLEIRFSGEFFRISGFKAPNRGIVEIFLNDKSLGEVDTYAPKDETSALLFSQYGLKNADHVLRFVATGKKNEKSTEAQVSFDAMEIGVAGTEAKATPTTKGIYEIHALSATGDPVAKASVRVGMNQPGAGVQVATTHAMLQRVFDGIRAINPHDGTVLDERIIENSDKGVFYNYTFDGLVRFQVEAIEGVNAIVNAIFFND